VVDPTPSEVEEALASLADSKQSLKEAEERVPPRPGLYAIYAGAKVWHALGLGEPPDDRPLYVGRAEDSLLSRDIRTHFGNGRTGQSTVRRSVAALLRETLDLRGIPRNPQKPGYFSNYGLSPENDRKVTKWMLEHLLLGVWAPASITTLRLVEVGVIQRLEPPLNLTGATTNWTSQIRVARKAMAEEARRWAANPDA
jgi:hypothetical protein